MSPIPSEESRRARRRRDGRADRRPPRQRPGAGRAVRPACEGRPEERHRHARHRQPEEAQAVAAGRGRRRRADRAGQLRRATSSSCGECDLVIEAIAERMDWKLDLYKKIAPHVAPHAILASNTSGLSITKLSRGAARGAEAALLRHPLLQPAALHVPGRADRHADHRRPGRWTTWRPSSPARSARAWCAPRTRPTSSPTASASPACWRR